MVKKSTTVDSRVDRVECKGRITKQAEITIVIGVERNISLLGDRALGITSSAREARSRGT